MDSVSGRIVGVGTYREGSFTLSTKEGDVTCYVSNMDKWDKLYDYMLSPRNFTFAVTATIEDGVVVRL